MIEKMVGGVRHFHPLESRNEIEAGAELSRFLQDPAAFRTRAEEAHVAAANALLLDADRLSAFMDHLEKQGRSEGYRRNILAYLKWWALRLKGRDLKALRLRDFSAELRGATSVTHRAMAIKSFCSWLQRQGLLEHHENACLSLRGEPAKRARAIEERAYPREYVEQIYRRVDVAAVRDTLRIRAVTGMHFSEINRCAQGLAKVTPLRGQSPIAATVRFIHKRGDAHTVSVDSDTLAAILRLQRLGRAPAESWVHKVLQRAADRLAEATGKPVEKLRPGRLRHSFITRAVREGREVHPKRTGISLEAAARAAGHTSTQITSLRYLGDVIPPLIRVPLRLRHPDDLQPGSLADSR